MTLNEKLRRLRPKETTMSTLMNGDIILSRESTMASWVIRKATSSEWSHVGLFFNQTDFISAVPFKGVCVQNISVVKTSAVYRLKGITEDQREALRTFVFSKMGTPYDMRQVFLLGWRILTNTINKHGDDPTPTKYECMEFVAEAYNSIGVQFGKYVDNLLPNMIVNSPLLEKVE